MACPHTADGRGLRLSSILMSFKRKCRDYWSPLCAEASMAGEKQRAASYRLLLIIPEVSVGLEILRPQFSKHFLLGKVTTLSASLSEATQLN